jgi:YD repeat-containing protein
MSATKRSLYAIDTYFSESWDDARNVLGDGLGAFCERHASVLLKADAVAARRLKPTLAWLHEQGFAIVAPVPVRLTRHVTRAIWRYQWNMATPDRKEMADLLFGLCDSMFLLVRLPSPGDLPATVALSHMKGPADPAKRRPGELRFHLGRHNFLINYVHTADEPADLLYEIGVFFPSAVRRRLFSQARAGGDSLAEAEALAEELYAQVPECDFDLAAALDRVASRCAATRPRGAPGDRDALSGLVTAVRAGRSRDWRLLFDLAGRLGVEIDPWDRVTIGTHLMTSSIADRDKVLPPTTPGDWGAQAEPAGGRSAERGSKAHR